MLVKVLFFGALKDVAGDVAEIELPQGATVGDLVSSILKDRSALSGYARSIAVAVNQEYARADQELRDEDEVALLPPVSGGSQAMKDDAPGRVSLVRQVIDSNEVVRTLKAPPDGAVVVFEGIVRDNSRGRRTSYLDYDAYEPMAIEQMERLVSQARAQFDVRDVRVVHRLGRLHVGETSVLIAVVSAHRSAGFDACRWLIDELKKVVPIWKKEFFEDGAVWADGEPFPPEVGIQT